MSADAECLEDTDVSVEPEHLTWGRLQAWEVLFSYSLKEHDIDNGKLPDLLVCQSIHASGPTTVLRRIDSTSSEGI